MFLVSYEEKLLKLDKDLSEKSSELILFSNMGGSLFLFIILVSLFAIALLMFFTADFIGRYFDSLDYKRNLIKIRNKSKNEDVIHLNNKCNLEYEADNNVKKELNLNLFEKLIYPFLFIYVVLLDFIEDFIWEYETTSIVISLITIVGLFMSSIIVLIYNIEVVNKTYSDGVYNEVKNYYEEKEYPIYYINVNSDSSDYQIHYFKEDNTINKVNVNKFFIDKNVDVSKEKSIGTIIFYNYTEFLIYVKNTDLDKLGLSSEFISKIDDITKSSSNNLIKNVRLLEIPNF